MPARHNNFDALRLAAAVLVVIGHAFILTGADDPPTAFGVPIDTLGVYVFFSISGDLVSGSWDNSPRLRRFFARRCLRIFPALITVVLITVFVIGPLASRFGVARYFSSGQTWAYLQTVTLLAQYRLPGVFTSPVHARTAVNGSLWTLGVEYVCYASIAAFGLVLGRFRTIGLAILSLACIAVAVHHPGADLPKGIHDAAGVIPFFAIAALYRARIPARYFTWRMAAVVTVAWALLVFWIPGARMEWAWIAAPFTVMTIGRASTPILRSVSRWGDFSYGTYLWAFLLQQVELDIMGRLTLWVDIPIVLAATLVVAFGSWHVVEKRALALRSTPGRTAPEVLRPSPCGVRLTALAGPDAPPDRTTRLPEAPRG